MQTQYSGPYEYYLRPGFKTYLRRIIEHPRSQFYFYSSLSKKTLTPIFSHIFNEKYGLLDLRESFGLFDRSDCSPMKDNKVLQHVEQYPSDTYKDLEKVFNS